MEKKVFRVILVLVVVLLCGYFLFGVVPSALFDTDYTVEAVEDCVYNDTVSVEGVALRTETVLVAGSDCATMVHNVSDGERVAVGTSVATVSNKAFSDEDEQRLLFLNRNIKILTKTVSSVVTSDATSLDADSREALYDYLDSCASSDMGEILAYEATLQTAFNKKNVNLNGDESYSKKLDEYLNERNSIIGKYTSVEQNVQSTVAGYFYSGYDGFEYLSAADADNMTVSSLEKILVADGTSCPSDYVGQVQTTPYWIFAAKMKSSDAASLKQGSSEKIEFRFSDGSRKTLQTSVLFVSSEENGYVCVCFRCGVMTEKELSLRKANCKLINSTYSGLKVSNKALRVVDGADGVYVLIGQKVVFKPVEILFSTDEFSIVKAKSDYNARRLTVNDEVICGGKDMFDGKIVNAK